MDMGRQEAEQRELELNKGLNKAGGVGVLVSAIETSFDPQVKLGAIPFGQASWCRGYSPQEVAGFLQDPKVKKFSAGQELALWETLHALPGGEKDEFAEKRIQYLRSRIIEGMTGLNILHDRPEAVFPGLKKEVKVNVNLESYDDRAGRRRHLAGQVGREAVRNLVSDTLDSLKNFVRKPQRAIPVAATVLVAACQTVNPTISPETDGVTNTVVTEAPPVFSGGSEMGSATPDNPASTVAPTEQNVSYWRTPTVEEMRNAKVTLVAERDENGVLKTIIDLDTTTQKFVDQINAVSGSEEKVFPLYLEAAGQLPEVASLELIWNTIGNWQLIARNKEGQLLWPRRRSDHVWSDYPVQLRVDKWTWNGAYELVPLEGYENVVFVNGMPVPVGGVCTEDETCSTAFNLAENDYRTIDGVMADSEYLKMVAKVTGLPEDIQPEVGEDGGWYVTVDNVRYKWSWLKGFEVAPSEESFWWHDTPIPATDALAMYYRPEVDFVNYVSFVEETNTQGFRLVYGVDADGNKEVVAGLMHTFDGKDVWTRVSITELGNKEMIVWANPEYAQDRVVVNAAVAPLLKEKIFYALEKGGQWDVVNAIQNSAAGETVNVNVWEGTGEQGNAELNWMVKPMDFSEVEIVFILSEDEMQKFKETNPEIAGKIPRPVRRDRSRNSLTFLPKPGGGVLLVSYYPEFKYILTKLGLNAETIDNIQNKSQQADFWIPIGYLAFLGKGDALEEDMMYYVENYPFNDIMEEGTQEAFMWLPAFGIEE